MLVLELALDERRLGTWLLKVAEGAGFCVWNVQTKIIFLLKKFTIVELA